MPVCKFYLKGNCKYGDKCRNEHPRHSGPRNDRHDQYDNGRRDNNWERTQHSQHREQRYQSPMTQRTDQWHDGHSAEGSRSDFRNRLHGYHDSYQDRSTSDHHYGHRSSHNDQYHWSKGQRSGGGNRFDKLNDEGQQSEPDAIIQTVKADIKSWADCSMWPFSCYSYAKGHACIDGLPDVSPEEMRVIFLLHQPQYQSIWNELEANYCRRKDELFEMSESEKQTLIDQMKITDSNPSQNLKLSLLYGNDYSFKAATSSVDSSAKILSTGNPNPLPKSTAITENSNTKNNPNKQLLSVFGLSSGGANSNIPNTSDIYTKYDDLSAAEKASFEAEKFVLGKIPTRPPPTQYCR